MVVRLYSGGVEGVDAYPVELEVDYMWQGLPGFTMVGLAEAAVREAKDRVFAALRACGFRLPPARITVNLAPAWRRKNGAGFDLPLAVGLLAAAGIIPVERLRGLYLTGELSLTGALRPVSGVLPMALLAREQHAAGLVVPPDNGAEAVMARGLSVYAPENLARCAAFLVGAEPLAP
ncbi:MAG: magnesium chelatase, partial [Desulfovibrio sp.]|nr:magnesium chelatase [Desulfovibrio sp.]